MVFPNTKRGDMMLGSYDIQTGKYDDDGHDHEFVSVCCGKPELDMIAGVCQRCKEFTTFECSCGRERSETDD